MTPIHWSVTKGHLDATLCLLDHGAQINIKDSLDRLPIDHANKKDLKQISTVLIAHSRTKMSLSTVWTLRLFMGLVIPIALFSLFVQLPLLFSLPAVFIIIAALMRLSGPAYPNLPSHSSNPFALSCGLSSCAVTLFIYYHYINIHTDLSYTESQVLLISGALYILMWAWLALTNPGFIGAKTDRKYRAEYLLDMVAEGTCTEQDIPEICPMCMIGRPVRSAHCYKSKKCVALYDHHAAWLNRPVGSKNLAVYCISCCLAVVVHFLFAKFCISVIDEVRPDENGFLMFLFDSYEHAPMLFFALVMHFALLLSAIAKLYERYKCFSYGMTLSEMQDPSARPYLFAGGSIRGGVLNNPFDRKTVFANAVHMMCSSDIDYTAHYFPSAKV
mmetsp:Transcript_11899/g.18078  ORF Transcript_11899/g.18078 Transcript_11899/m.18078 type:complete len:387 (+) Transcript_11899:1178-2338(+)